uniref:Major capsid protein n=2 Tax=unclassified bacterial viruses TaxID=12333 RepID=A0AAU6W2R0_9VIRU
MDPRMKALLERAGIAYDASFGNTKMLPEGRSYRDMVGLANDGSLVAMDAQYPLLTTANSGIPAFLSTYIDPKVIEVLVAPMKAAIAIGGETKKGDWTTRTAMFPVIESTGETTSYGDYDAGGSTGANFQFPQRQSFHFQTITQWGERELADAGLAKIDYAARLNIASALTLNKYQNKSYIFGVAGLQNYGMLNDPALAADITPNTKAAGGTAWILPNGNVNATAVEVQRDITKLFAALQIKNQGLVETTDRLKLIMDPLSSVALTITDPFNVNVSDILKKTYPNLVIEVIPEYNTAGGRKLQLVLEEYEGQRTWDAAFTEKQRSHAVVVDLSSWKQKKSAGTWGTTIYRPNFISSMIGI